MSDQIAKAAAAFERGDHALGRDLLFPLAEAGDHEAQAVLGTYCWLDLGSFDAAERWLRTAADAGHGGAAHNLGVLYSTGWPGQAPDADRSRHYLKMACDSGFEHAVASAPMWWKR